MSDKFRKNLLPNLPYGVIFITVWSLSGQLPWIPFHGALVGLAVAVMLRGVVYIKGKNAKKYRKNIEYGSARFGNDKDIKPYVDPKSENNIVLTATESLTMNSRPTPIKYARNKNVLVIGGAGSGKTQFFVKPNLCQCDSTDYPVSFVVTDSKGGLVRETASMLKRKGYQIKILNTIDFKRSHRYNPFQYIRKESDILKFVTALIANTRGDGKSADPFWEKAEVLLYQALIGYIWYEAPPEEQNMNSLVEMINQMEVREGNEAFKNSVDLTFETLEERDPNHFAVRQYKKFKLSAGSKTAKSILISCGARLSPFDIGEVRDLMSADELELDKLGERKTALFVVVSDSDDSFNFIPALMYSQLFNTLCDLADSSPGGHLPVHVRCLLDEFSNIGKIPNFERLIATIRSREISACVILQAQSQLKHLYKDASEVIVGNMDSILFLGGREKSTLEEISKMLGRETIDMYNTSRTRGMQESYGQNFQKLGRELKTIDELAMLDGAKCILQIRGVRPFLSNKYDLTKHPNYRYLADSNPKNRFNVERHLSTKLKLKENEVYEVFEIDVGTKTQSAV